jgi:hypothetical protein
MDNLGCMQLSLEYHCVLYSMEEPVVHSRSFGLSPTTPVRASLLLTYEATLGYGKTTELMGCSFQWGHPHGARFTGGETRRPVSLTGQHRWPILWWITCTKKRLRMKTESDESSPGPHILILEDQF